MFHHTSVCACCLMKTRVGIAVIESVAANREAHQHQQTFPSTDRSGSDIGEMLDIK